MRREIGTQSRRLGLGLKRSQPFEQADGTRGIESGGTGQQDTQIVRLEFLFVGVGSFQPLHPHLAEPGANRAPARRRHRGGCERGLSQHAVDGVSTNDMGHFMPDNERQLIAVAGAQVGQGLRDKNETAR